MEKRSRPELFSLACFYLVELPESNSAQKSR
jgi:hypothetical protein